MIAIVGGGITGLALGWELQARGSDFVVLEGTDRLGGIIRSGEIEGTVVEWGPQRTRETALFRRLVESLGIEDQVITAPADLGLFVYRGGRLRGVPYSARAFVGTDVVSLGAKLRLLLEPLTAGADPDESVADFFSRKVGRELYETLIGPLFGGLYASDPADMLVGISLSDLLRQAGVGRSLVNALLRSGGRISPPPACSFERGMQVLPDALGAALGERLRMRAPVCALEPVGSGWRVGIAAAESGRGQVASGGASEWIEADAVVLTPPAPAVARLLRPAAPAVAEALGRLTYNPLSMVHLHAETEMEGLGFQVAFTERELMLRGVTYNDSLFRRRNLYTAFLGGARHPEVRDLDEATLGARAVEEFRQTTGHESRVLSVQHVAMPAWDRSWKALDGVRAPDGIHFASNWWSRAGLPGRFAEAKRLAEALA